MAAAAALQWQCRVSARPGAGPGTIAAVLDRVVAVVNFNAILWSDITSEHAICGTRS